MAGDRHGIDRRRAPGEGLEEAAGVLRLEHPGHEVERPVGERVTAEGVGDRPRRRGVMPAVEPHLAAGRQARDERAVVELLQPRRPFGPAHRRAQRAVGDRHGVLRAQHRDRQRGIVELMRAGEARQRQRDLAPAVAQMERALVHRGIPVVAADQQPGAGEPRHLGDPRGHRLGVARHDEGHAALGDARLFAGDVEDRMPEPLLMIEAQRGDPGDDRRHHIGRIEAATEPDLDHCGVGGRADEGDKGDRGGQLEEGDRRGAVGVEDIAQGRDQRRVVDQRPVQPDSLVEADEMRRGIDVDPPSRRFERGAEEGGGRPLAVGPGDVEHRRQLEVRVAEPAEQAFEARQPEVDRRRVQPEGGRQQGVEHRIVRPCRLHQVPRRPRAAGPNPTKFTRRSRPRA